MVDGVRSHGLVSGTRVCVVSGWKLHIVFAPKRGNFFTQCINTRIFFLNCVILLLLHHGLFSCCVVSPNLFSPFYPFLQRCQARALGTVAEKTVNSVAPRFTFAERIRGSVTPFLFMRHSGTTTIFNLHILNIVSFLEKRFSITYYCQNSVPSHLEEK